MAEVGLSAVAREDLEWMIVTHSLPADTKDRVRRSLRVLGQFPRIGRPLDGRWAPLRLLGATVDGRKRAGVVELADTPALGAGGREPLGVRVSPPASASHILSWVLLAHALR